MVRLLFEGCWNIKDNIKTQRHHLYRDSTVIGYDWDDLIAPPKTNMAPFSVQSTVCLQDGC